jgi:hypothetical protein
LRRDDLAVNVYERLSDSENRGVEYLCREDWDLETQFDALAEWLIEHEDLPHSDYVADVGFSLRSGATGGGPVVTTEMMDRTLRIGMQLFLSQYDDGG